MKDIFLRNFNKRQEETTVEVANINLNTCAFLSPQHSKCHPPLRILQVGSFLFCQAEYIPLKVLICTIVLDIVIIETNLDSRLRVVHWNL